MKIRLDHKFEDLIGMFNLLLAWEEFIKGKRSKKDVQEFYMNLMDNILSLHYDLANKIYRHGGYEEFHISDPKPRTINKASVRDRFLHHAVYRILYPFFDEKFISDSFSCRNKKGTHRAIKRLNDFYRKVSRNKTKTCWILKCDIKKFFHSINQQVLIEILGEYIPDRDIVNLLREIITSFHYAKEGVGLPLGNLTSQLFANVYMDKFDQFVKHKLKVKYYIRYADDFVILSEDKNYLKEIIPLIGDFLQNRLSLVLHPDKISIKTLYSGIDFLGWVNFKHHKTIRNTTRNRILKGIKENRNSKTLSSYVGLLKHGNTQKVKSEVLKLYSQNILDL